MNKKISLGAAIAYMAIVAAITFSLTNIYSVNSFNSMMKNIDEREATYSKLAEIDLLVQDNYYGAVVNDQVLASTAAGYVAGLGDPASRYMTAKEYEEYSKVETGKYVGIGVVTELSEDGYIKLKTVYPDSPADYVGLRAGDIIISVDGTPAKADNYNDLTAQLKGEAGTKIALVKRIDNEESSLELTRREIDIPTVQSQLIETVGYLRFGSITSTTSQHMDKAIKQLTDTGATSLVIDMRGMKSDNMEYIIDMLDYLMPAGDIVNLQYKGNVLKVLAESDSKSVALPITVLADDTTSGACEMFVQAIREQANCKFVGTTTAGKGSLQEAYKLNDGSALLLTTALYSSAKGQTYDKVGVVPDYDIKLGTTEEEKLSLMGSPDTDLQLRKAIELCQTAVLSVSTSASSSSATSSN